MLLQAGDVIELRSGHTVYADIPKHFAYSNHVGNFELDHVEVVIGNHKGLNTEFMIGRWIVTHTCEDGGGTGHGPYDVYPNGHHVFCERAVEDSYDYKMKIDFYQTGAFTAMIREGEVNVIGKAKANYTYENSKL